MIFKGEMTGDNTGGELGRAIRGDCGGGDER